VPYASDLVSKAFPDLQYQVPAALGYILFAVVVMFFILIEPRGLYYRLERIKVYYRLNPFAY
jgi:ABC-type branched-subunit amino acid transport system permease subunit